MTLLELHSLTEGVFAVRVESAAKVAAIGVEWTAPDFASASPVEKASRQVLGGADLSVVVLRAAVTAYQLGVPMSGDDDVAATDSQLIDLVGGLLVAAFGHGEG